MNIDKNQKDFTDLFEKVDSLPVNAKELVEKYLALAEDDEGFMEYDMQAQFLDEIEATGYTFDMGMDGYPAFLRKIGELHYGDIVEIECDPILPEHHFQAKMLGGIAITSSENKEKVKCIVLKYWETDTDANEFKVKLVPIESDKYFGKSMYSSDLSNMIKQKQIKHKKYYL
jgi:hypothetical protein